MAETAPLPAPGSAEASAAGCKCPVIDNGRGRGAYVGPDGKPLFWLAEDCPLHGQGVARG